MTVERVEPLIKGQVVTCDATATFCACVKQAGHVAAGDPLHECDPATCTGAWTGNYGSDDWRPVRFPRPAS